MNRKINYRMETLIKKIKILIKEWKGSLTWTLIHCHRSKLKINFKYWYMWIRMLLCLITMLFSWLSELNGFYA